MSLQCGRQISELQELWPGGKFTQNAPKVIVMLVDAPPPLAQSLPEVSWGRVEPLKLFFQLCVHLWYIPLPSDDLECWAPGRRCTLK